MIKTNIKMRVTPEQLIEIGKIKPICKSFTKAKYIFIYKNGSITWSHKQYEFDRKETMQEIDPDLFIRTNGSCIEKEEFTYPMWFKNKYQGYVVRFDGLTIGEVVYGFENWLLDSVKSNNWIAHTYDSDWVQVPNPDLVTDIDNNKAKNPNSKHYELWENFEAIDVIKLALTDEEYKGFLKGNILKYRLRAGKKNIENDNIIKDINKSIDYQKELNK